jgi:hypothetical protein
LRGFPDDPVHLFGLFGQNTDVLQLYVKTKVYAAFSHYRLFWDARNVPLVLFDPGLN